MIIIVALLLHVFYPHTGLCRIGCSAVSHLDVPETDAIFLTFDDGPVPGVTDKGADMLYASSENHLLCIGHNVRNTRNYTGESWTEGHAVGNHTFHHLNGWRSNIKPIWRM